MRATLYAVLIIAVLSFAGGGCDENAGGPRPGTGPGEHKRTAGVLGGTAVTAEDWQRVAGALLAAQQICTAFRGGDDASLSTTEVRVTLTGYAGQAGLPAVLVNGVGEYYRGSLTPDTADHAQALAIRRARIVRECDRIRM